MFQSCRCVKTEGKIGPAVCELVQSENVNMIILGERASGGMGRLFLRPVYDHVLKHAKVLNEYYSSIKKIYI